MTRPQYIALLSALALFLGLYFGFDTVPKHKPVGEQMQSGGNHDESNPSASLLTVGKKALTPEQATQVADLEQRVSDAKTDAEKVIALKTLSGWWYRAGHIEVAGMMAEQVAELEQTDSAWSVAGGTFFNGLQASQDPDIRTYCTDQAISAFEKAASLNPTKVEHRVNLALVYAENPRPDNPMQAVMMLRDLEQKNPDAPAVYNALGRLAIKTNQWDKAIARLEKSWGLDKKNPNTPCLLSKAYEGAGDLDKASEFAKLCK